MIKSLRPQEEARMRFVRKKFIILTGLVGAGWLGGGKWVTTGHTGSQRKTPGWSGGRRGRNKQKV